jgi:hypothetical protein
LWAQLNVAVSLAAALAVVHIHSLAASGTLLAG